jgi:hypothetical protein
VSFQAFGRQKISHPVAAQIASFARPASTKTAKKEVLQICRDDLIEKFGIPYGVNRSMPP